MEITDPNGGSAVAMKKGSADLLEQVNKTIKRLKDEDKINQFVVDINKLVDWCYLRLRSTIENNELEM